MAERAGIRAPCWRERGLRIGEEWWRHHRVQTILHTSMAWLTHAGAPKPAPVRGPASDTGWHLVDVFISTFGGVRDLAEMWISARPL